MQISQFTAFIKENSIKNEEPSSAVAEGIRAGGHRRKLAPPGGRQKVQVVFEVVPDAGAEDGTGETIELWSPLPLQRCPWCRARKKKNISSAKPVATAHILTEIP